MNLFARPSVTLCKVSTPVAVLRQASTRSGFHAGRFGKNAIFPGFLRLLAVARTTESGFSLKAVSAVDSGFCLRRSDYRSAALLSPCSRPVLVTGPAFSQPR
jgi:hypothetical protein